VAAITFCPMKFVLPFICCGVATDMCLSNRNYIFLASFAPRYNINENKSYALFFEKEGFCGLSLPLCHLNI
jgi:hypothetical protein